MRSLTALSVVSPPPPDVAAAALRRLAGLSVCASRGLRCGRFVQPACVWCSCVCADRVSSDRKVCRGGEISVLSRLLQRYTGTDVMLSRPSEAGTYVQTRSLSSFLCGSQCARTTRENE